MTVELNVAFGSKLIAWVARTLRDAAWAPITVFSIHVVTSMTFGGYVKYPWIDMPMHFAGGVVIAFFIHRATLNAANVALVQHTDTLTHYVLFFALVSMATVMWKFAEFLADTFFATGAQKGVRENISDMFMGMVGGLIFLIAQKVFSRPCHE